jgi:phosphoesterase RecJ-like protein
MTETPRLWPLVQLAEAEAAIAAADSILLVTHIHPDGDAIGSLLGLTNALAARGKAVTAAVDEGTPDYLNFLPGADRVLAKPEGGPWSLLISLDASDEERTGEWGTYGRAHSRTVINVDHHPTNTGFGSIYLVDPGAVSTTEILFHWLTAVAAPLTTAVAVPLLTGLVTDTMGFSTSNVTARTLAIAQRLVEAGASLAEITARTLNSNPYATVVLWSRALQTVSLEGGVIAASISQADFQSVGLTEPSDSGLVSFLNTVNESQIAVTFRETSDGSVSISMRCKPGYDVSAVATALGGGGHRQAAGATIPGPLDAARERVLPLLRAAVEQGQRANG